MYFHVIGIKEDNNKKYNIDIVLESESDSIAKDFLHWYNIVTLSFIEYKENIQSFWNIEIIINYKQKKIRIFSDLNNIYSTAKYFMMIGFDVSYANFLLPSDKLEDVEISKIIKETKMEVENIQLLLKQELKYQKDREKEIYNDENLKKTVKFCISAIEEIDSLLNSIEIEKVSQDKIRDIKIISQELLKLKMWRNVDKMIEVLENTYHKIYEIKKEYFLHKTPKFDILWSDISDLDMIQEIHKYEKAQNIKKIWANRDSDDNYYLSFEKTGIYFKFLLKDLKNKLKNISRFIYSIFDYFEIFLIFTPVVLAIYFRLSKVSYSSYDNLYVYYSFIQIWTLWLSLYLVKIFRRASAKTNLLLFILFFVIYYFLFWFLKNNLSF